MISSIQALTKPRKLQKIKELMTLASMIPCQPGDKFVRQKVLQRLLNIESYQTARPSEHSKNHAILRTKIDQGLITLDGKTDIVEQFIIKSILQKQNWGDLIIQNQWNKIFYQNGDKWSYYQQWIVALCFKGFEKQHAKFLSSNLTKRSLKIIRLHQVPYISSSCWQQKFQKWIHKDIQQLELIYYEIERNLLISIKLQESIQQTSSRLKLENILKSTINPMEYQSNDWIFFLCSQFKTNKPVKRPEFDGRTQTFSWSKVQSRLKKDRICQYEKKLRLILKNCLNLFESFTNEIQVSLLSDIKFKNTWKVAQNNIQKLFHSTNEVKWTQMKKQQWQCLHKDDYTKNPSSNVYMNENNKNLNIANLFSNTLKNTQYLSTEDNLLNKFTSSEGESKIIYSLQILTLPRSNVKICEIMALAQIIPCWPQNQLIKERVLERVLNIDYSRRKSFKGYNKIFITLQEKIKNNILTLEDKKDPVEIMFMIAVLKNQRWEDLIIKNKWDKHFIQIEEEWSAYEQWIVFLCFNKFQNDKGRFLTSSIIRRSNRGIYYQWYCQRTGIRGRNTNHFTKRLEKWLNKDVSQLQKIHYEIERCLLISIKLQQNFIKTSRRMNLQKIISSEINPMECNRKDWISYLCSKITDNYLIKTPEFNEETSLIQWQEYKQEFKSKQTCYQFKLQCILYKYQNVGEHFTNEIQASLLKDISLNTRWKQAEQHIYDIYNSDEKVLHNIQAKTIFQYKREFQNNSNILTNNRTEKQQSTIVNINCKKEKFLQEPSLTQTSDRGQIMWSLPILMQNRDLSRTIQLIALACAIPSEPKDTFVRQKVLERLLNLHRFDSFQAHNKKKIDQIEIDLQRLSLYEKQDPIEQLFIEAILQKQSWSDLITKYKWNKLFYRIQDKWSQYEIWILYICFQRYDERKSTFLSSNLLKRGNQAIHMQINLFNTSFLRNKFKKWINKDISQLECIHYEIQRNLLVSIKLEQSFQQTATRLNLQGILKSTANPTEYDRGEWIYFLCSQFADNKPVKRPQFDGRTEKFSWGNVQSRLKKDKLCHYESKLRLILEKYSNFFQSFTNETEACLLSDIHLKSTWKVAQVNIQNYYQQKGYLKKEQKINIKQEQYAKNTLDIQDVSRSKSVLQFIKQLNMRRSADSSLILINLDEDNNQIVKNQYECNNNESSLIKKQTINEFVEKIDQFGNRLNQTKKESID